jgi:hypothetical protein
MPSKTVNKIHFSDFGPENFERLVFAFHLRDGWQNLEWYGQSGSDMGRDIIGIQPVQGSFGRRTVIQCVNRKTLTLGKCEKDMKGACASPTGVPDGFKFVSSANVSAQMRDKIRKAGGALGIAHIEVWSGAEFEEALRARAESILDRFVKGEDFPDTVPGLRKFVDDHPDICDADKLTMFAAVLDRPAFHTPVHCETSIYDLRQAVEDTISALNTGRWRNRDGDLIRLIPSRHTFRNPAVRDALGKLTVQIDQIRQTIIRRLKDGTIRPCQCGKSDCPVTMIDPSVQVELDDARRAMFHAFDRIRALV